jgi:DNA (cytosine-5)-methyltransferase 1
VGFEFVDLFAGVGGFHAALAGLGGECVLVSELDKACRKVYESNWGALDAHMPLAVPDIRDLSRHPRRIQDHAVLAAGFPCQPFSKSGLQRGIEETRGTLFWDILKILEAKRPAVVFLENVRNLAGGRHRATWNTIVLQLRDLGYRVSSEPAVMSPHLLPPWLGGTPQVRDRVFVLGTYVGRRRAMREIDVAPVVTRAAVEGWEPTRWDVFADLPTERPRGVEALTTRLTFEDEQVLNMWDDFLQSIRMRGKVPGFPIWSSFFSVRPRVEVGTPEWKRVLIRKNIDLYVQNRDVIDDWRKRWPELRRIPASRRKFEWQAQDAKSVWDCAIQFRPSGLRCKLPNYLPALVAMAQTSYLAPLRRRITVREAARLQGFSDRFEFGQQLPSASFRQLGNAVPPRLAYWILRKHLLENQDDVSLRAPHLVESALAAPAAMPDVLCDAVASTMAV